MNLPKNVDKLTRLYNDVFLEEEFVRELKRAERYKRPLTFLLIDPGIPEENYQQVGYLALKKLASISREFTRYLDYKIRIKNRVLIMLPETDYDGALKVAEKISQKVSEMSFRQFPEVKTHAKIGIASFPEDGIDKNDILRALEEDLEKPLDKKLATPVKEVFRENQKVSSFENHREYSIRNEGIDEEFTSDIEGMMKL